MSDDSSVRTSAQSAPASQADSTTDPVQHHATGRLNKKNEPDPSPAKPLESPDLSQRQLLALEFLLQGLSDAAVAAKIGVDRTTVYRWRTVHTPFRWELDRLRRQVLQHSADRLRALLYPSLDVLATHLHSDDPKVSLRAAALIARIAGPSRRDLTPDPVTSPRRNRSELDDIIEATRCTHGIPEEDAEDQGDQDDHEQDDNENEDQEPQSNAQ